MKVKIKRGQKLRNLFRRKKKDVVKEGPAHLDKEDDEDEEEESTLITNESSLSPLSSLGGVPSPHFSLTVPEPVSTAQQHQSSTSGNFIQQQQWSGTLPLVVALLALDPHRMMFEMKEVPIRKTAKCSPNVGDLMAQIPMSFEDTSICTQSYYGVVNSDGQVGSADESLASILSTKSTLWVQILVLIPSPNEGSAYHAMASEILMDQDIRHLLQTTKGYDVTAWDEETEARDQQNDSAARNEPCNHQEPDNAPLVTVDVEEEELVITNVVSDSEQQVNHDGDENTIDTQCITDNIVSENLPEGEHHHGSVAPFDQDLSIFVEFQHRQQSVHNSRVYQGSEVGPTSNADSDSPMPVRNDSYSCDIEVGVANEETCCDEEASEAFDAVRLSGSDHSTDESFGEEHRGEEELHQFETLSRAETESATLNDSKSGDFQNEQRDEDEEEEDVAPQSCWSRCCDRCWRMATGRSMTKTPELEVPLLQDTE